jgi:hypothetical protein
MKQINVFDFYQLGANLDNAVRLTAGKPLKEYTLDLFFLKLWMDRIVADRTIPLQICKPQAKSVLTAIDELIPYPATSDGERIVNDSDLYMIIQGTKDFAVIFSAEVQNLATYFVSKKAIYDTNDLIQRADEMFSEEIRASLSDQVKQDLKEMGKCLAFDLATAAGFHITRAVEGVVLDYLKVLCPSEVATMKDSSRNLGAFIKLAREHGGDDKVCASLDQFRDLHRNPLIHPESVLTIDEALTLLGIAQSAIVAIVTDIHRRARKVPAAVEPRSVLSLAIPAPAP